MFQLRTLGAFDLVGPNGTRVHSIILQPKRAALLVYLSLSRSGEFHRRDSLLPLFWPESDQSSARHSLSQAIYKVRQALGESVIEARGDEEIRLGEGVVFSDATAFLDALKRSDWGAALESYSGEFLAGFHVSADGFERWAEDQRKQLRDAAAHAAWSLADEQLDRGSLAEAQRTATRALKLDPSNETAARTFMQRLGERGARAEAMGFYEQLRLALSESVELEPSAETRRLAAQLLVDRPDSSAERTVEATSAKPSRTRPRMPMERMPLRNIWWLVPAAALTLPLLYAAEAKPKASRADAHMESLVVLPLENLGQDRNEEYFVGGMHEALIGELARIKSLRVISRTSALHYRGTSKSIDEITRELGVDGAVEGSVLHTGDSVRIDVQLMGARPERHIWSASYQRPLKNVLMLHREVASAIAKEVSATLTRGDSVHLSQHSSVSAPAYDAWLRGSYARSRRSASSDADCIRFGSEAVSRDSNYAPAYQLLAECFSIQNSVASAPPRESFGKTKAAARRAIELDESLALAHTSLARALAMYDWDWTGAEREYQRAIEVNGGLATPHAEYGWFLSWLGRMDEAAVQLARAEELNPISPDVAMHVSMVLYLAGRTDDAIKKARHAIEIDSTYMFGYDRLHWVYDAQGMYGEALDAARRAERLAGPRDLRRRAFLAYAYARAGQRAEAIAMLNELSELSRHAYVPPSAIAVVYVGLGDRKSALEWLQRGYAGHDADMVLLKTWPIWSSLRSEPRYRALVQGMGLDR